MAVEDRISHLERFQNEDKKHEHNVVFTALEDFVGPLKDRERTDKKWIWPVAIMIAIFLAHGFSCKFYTFRLGNFDLFSLRWRKT